MTLSQEKQCVTCSNTAYHKLSYEGLADTVSWKGVIVEDFVTIGANVTLIAGVKLGHHCMIGAGSVVTKDIPPHELWFGNPAKLVRTLL